MCSFQSSERMLSSVYETCAGLSDMTNEIRTYRQAPDAMQSRFYSQNYHSTNNRELARPNYGQIDPRFPKKSSRSAVPTYPSPVVSNMQSGSKSSGYKQVSVDSVLSGWKLIASESAQPYTSSASHTPSLSKSFKHAPLQS